MSNTVLAVVWPWRDKPAGAPGQKIVGHPGKSALIQAVIMAVIGLLVYQGLGHRTMGIIVWSFAAVVLVSGLFIPPVFFAIERFGKLLGKGVATALTWGLLVPFYYLCFVPAHVVLKLRGKDPLRRQFPTDEPTYWIPRKPIPDVSQYRKQF